MEKIDSFKVNHDLLNQGIYVSRIDKFGKTVITTFDIRCKKPNSGDVMPIAALHTLEHLAATFFRNSDMKDKIVGLFLMGCQTGLYLVVEGDYPLFSKEHKNIISLIINMFRFVVKFKGKIPGSSKIECGNYKSHDLETAKLIAANMLVMFEDFCILEYVYPTGDLERDNESHRKEQLYIYGNKNIPEAKEQPKVESNLFDIKEVKTEAPISYKRERVSNLSVLSESEKASRRAVPDSSVPLF